VRNSAIMASALSPILGSRYAREREQPRIEIRDRPSRVPRSPRSAPDAGKGEVSNTVSWLPNVSDFRSFRALSSAEYLSSTVS